MRRVGVLVFALCLLAVPAPAGTVATPFESEQALQNFLNKERQEAVQRAAEEKALSGDLETVVLAEPVAHWNDNPPEVPGADSGTLLKRHGDHLILLRCDRLVSLSLEGKRLASATLTGAYFNELLIAGDRLIVIGGVWDDKGTVPSEVRQIIERFDIAKDGTLTFVDSYELRGGRRAFVSRLAGTRLTLFTGDFVRPEPDDAMPGLRRRNGVYRRIVKARDVFTAQEFDKYDWDETANVVNCDIAAPTLACTARTLLVPNYVTVHATADTAYLWARRDTILYHDRPDAILFRVPLDGGAPASLGVYGEAHAFRETGKALLVAVEADYDNDAPWGVKARSGDSGLVTIPLAAFKSDEAIPLSAYHIVSGGAGDFVTGGRRLLHLGDRSVGLDWASYIVVTDVKTGATTHLDLPCRAHLIAPMGRDALAICLGEKDTSFVPIATASGRPPAVGEAYVLPREELFASHLFAFDPASGLIGIPLSHSVQYNKLLTITNQILFLRWVDGRLKPAGALTAVHSEIADRPELYAACEYGCSDARPLFINGRIFALLGDELVEASPKDLHEIARHRFLPKTNP